MLKILALIWAASAVKISRKKFEEMKTMNLTEEIRKNFLARFDNDGTRYWSSSYSSGYWDSSSHHDIDEVCAIDA